MPGELGHRSKDQEVLDDVSSRLDSGSLEAVGTVEEDREVEMLSERKARGKERKKKPIETHGIASSNLLGRKVKESERG